MVLNHVLDRDSPSAFLRDFLGVDGIETSDHDGSFVGKGLLRDDGGVEKVL